MKTRNAMQLKALINNRAKSAGVSPQLMLQNYELWHVRGCIVRGRTLAQALEATSEKRNSWEAVERHGEIIDDMREDAGLRRQWQTYASKHSYAAGLSLEETLDAVREVMESITPFL